MELRQRVKTARQYAQLSQEALAAKAGVGQQLISKLERGERRSSTKLIDIAIACGVSAMWLTKEQGPMTGAITPRSRGTESTGKSDFSSGSGRPDGDMLRKALSITDRVLASLGARDVSPSGRTEIAIAFYELIQAGVAAEVAEKSLQGIISTIAAEGRPSKTK